MELSLSLAEQIASMVLISVAGFIVTYFKVLSAEDSGIISKVCVYIIIPCSLINAFQTELSPDRLSGFLIALIAGILIHALFLIVTKLFDFTPIKLDNVEKASIIYNNSGNLIIPLVAGTLGTEYIFYTSAYIVVQNLLVWSHGVIIMGGGKANFKKIIANPCMISIFIGITLFVCQIRIIGPVGIAISNTASCIGPLSMLMVGMMLGNQNLKEVFSNYRAYGITFIRLILYPALTMIILLTIDKLWIHSDMENVLLVSLFCAIGPAAAVVTQQAQLYDNPKKIYVSSINIVSTVLCAITMPIMTILFQYLLKI
ncbi:MAG: hypothetical protein BEN19_05420 [Epulopiscium sp. Nuni2H_MBin003]|nr:MAG: hypothetical protein BEN19_05420 [Epulopiscium sp. Nuni2H_MBin003]